MVIYEVPPIMKPPPAVVRYAETHQVRLFFNECRIKPEKRKGFHYKEYKGVYPCLTDDDICIILYKNRRQMRFATPDEINELYWDFR